MGKLVVFWSPWHGQAGTTANMCAVAVALHHLQGESVILAHSQFGMADLEGMYNMRMNLQSKKELYTGTGLSALMMYFKQAAITANIVSNCVIPSKFSDGIYLLPGVEMSSMARSDETNKIIEAIFARDIPKYYDWTFVDAAAGGNALSQMLMQRADLIVVNLSQNAATWQQFFCEDGPNKWLFDSKKAFYVIGGYHKQSSFNIKKFASKYDDYVESKGCGTIPFCVKYMDAISRGQVDHFLHANIHNGKDRDNDNAEFIAEIKKTAKLVQAFVPNKPKEG